MLSLYWGRISSFRPEQIGHFQVKGGNEDIRWCFCFAVCFGCQLMSSKLIQRRKNHPKTLNHLQIAPINKGSLGSCFGSKRSLKPTAGVSAHLRAMPLTYQRSFIHFVAEEEEVGPILATFNLAGEMQRITSPNQFDSLLTKGQRFKNHSQAASHSNTSRRLA